MTFEFCAEQVALANQLWFVVLKRSSCQTVGEDEIVVCGKITYLSSAYVLKPCVI